ncbi:MAG TPA: DUF4446 family protein [Candidatus Nitrosocosmicus sp.]|nr:DUF4446 family protein [Candidatus Nitrosocosmicus sp.]
MEFILFGVIGLLTIWVVILSIFLFKTRSHYNNLIRRTGRNNIDQILERLIKDTDTVKTNLDKVEASISNLESKQKLSFQKIGFLRFNPFERVSGDQSFIMSLLNNENTGIILNFLYTREGIRVYAKKVDKGVSEEYELSSEEREVIQIAK